MIKYKLSDLLYRISQISPLLTYINTNNDTFPKEYRYPYIRCWDLFNVLDAHILSRNVKSINGEENNIVSIMTEHIERKDEDIITILNMEIE